MWFYPNKYTHVLIHVSFLLQVLTFVALEPYVFFPQCVRSSLWAGAGFQPAGSGMS